PGEHRLSHALDRLRGQRHRGVAAPRRVALAAAAFSHRRDNPRRLPGGPLVAAYIPFARPEIDEDTIAAVSEVLRSGWITSGPQVQRFASALAAYFGGPPVPPFP